jgi:hypothetical protein
MDTYIDIKIDKLVAKISIPQGRNDSIVAFGAIWLYEPEAKEPIIKIKGFTIRSLVAKSTNSKFLKISFPAYRAGQNFVTSFVTENTILLEQIRKAILNEYYQQVGDNPHQNPEPEVNIDDIPF